MALLVISRRSVQWALSIIKRRRFLTIAPNKNPISVPSSSRILIGQETNLRYGSDYDANDFLKGSAEYVFMNGM